MPALSLLLRPGILSVTLQPDVERSPTTVRRSNVIQSAVSVLALSPVYYRRKIARLVSYYALFK